MRVLYQTSWSKNNKRDTDCMWRVLLLFFFANSECVFFLEGKNYVHQHMGLVKSIKGALK